MRSLGSLSLASITAALLLFAAAPAHAQPAGSADAGAGAAVTVDPAGATTGATAPAAGGTVDVNAGKEPSAAGTTDATGQAGARAVGTAPPGVNYGNFMDTRLSWTFGDDDFLHKTGELVPLSPTFSIGDRPQYRLFFDNLNSRFSGRENLTHLVMYKKMPGFIPKLTTEAALVLRFDLQSLSAATGNLNSALQDAGS
jgi:hypothetical protein